jgi:hypothetical protein
MQPTCTDAATSTSTNERGTARAFLSPPASKQPTMQQRRERLDEVLALVNTDRLKATYLDQLKQGNQDGALLVSAELTRRGIAPSFRGLPVRREWWMGTDTDFVLMTADLQWIVARHPQHQTEWERAQAIFDPRKFDAAAAYLHWNGNRTAGQVAKALGLTDAQQRECAWIQCLHVERWRQRLHTRWPIARAKIADGIKAHDRRAHADQDATIKRRSDLWLCAELADWKPQRTADLFAMLTGEALPRNVVAKQLDKLPKVRRTDSVCSS